MIKYLTGLLLGAFLVTYYVVYSLNIEGELRIPGYKWQVYAVHEFKAKKATPKFHYWKKQQLNEKGFVK